MGFLRTPDETKIVPDVNQVPVAIIEPSSSSEEEDEIEPIHLPEHQPRRGAQPRHKLLQALKDGVSCRNCKVGRRWSRRIDNNAFLQNLIKGEEQHEDIVEQEPSVFERLLCNEDAMKLWETFMSQPEEEQHAFLTKQFAKVRAAKERCAQEMSEKQPDGRPIEGRKCFKRVCPLVQKFLNSEELPKGTLLSLEPCIIEFFLAEPTGQFVSDPLGNDDRKVLHGLAQYMELNSQSFNSEVSCDHRCTKVTNSKDTFTAPTVLLSEFLGIRYLASGNTFTDLHFYYKLGISTISKIVENVCSSIWEILRSECFPELTSEKLKEISDGFLKKSQFPHCVGAVDGKHIRIVKPEHSGSLNFNYKGYFSIVLMAVCDANYRFTFVDIGAYGSEADPTVFQKSILWKNIQDEAIEFPKSEPLPGSESPNIPYFFLGDEAFPLSTKLMRPFAGHNLSIQKRVFNYRLSRGRRLIECTFGIMSNKWRIFHRPMNVNIDLAVKITKACVILHNFVRERDGNRLEDDQTVVGWKDLPVHSNQETNQSL